MITRKNNVAQELSWEELARVAAEHYPNFSKYPVLFGVAVGGGVGWLSGESPASAVVGAIAGSLFLLFVTLPVVGWWQLQKIYRAEGDAGLLKLKAARREEKE